MKLFNFTFNEREVEIIAFSLGKQLAEVTRNVMNSLENQLREQAPQLKPEESKENKEILKKE